MTLDDLIKAVEAGDDDAVKRIIYGMASAARDKGEHFPIVDISFAYYRNRLDAAKDLHKALLPGWKVGVLHEEWNGKWLCRIYGLRPEDGAYAEASDPARAWLLAILKAKQAEGRG